MDNQENTPFSQCWDTPLGRAYLTLFNAMTDALAALEAQNFELAGEILRAGQQNAEDLLLDADDPLSPAAPIPTE